jgi:cysteine desulfurase/selenocysteine lyase
MKESTLNKIRSDFPALNQKINGRPLIYFDNAATTLNPASVQDALSNYYNTINSNVHRGVHSLSQQATDAFENARKTVQKFINAENTSEIIFTKGTTEAINLVAYSFGKEFIKEGDEIIISVMEHHANIVPWQMVCEEKGAKLKIIPMDDTGNLIIEDFENLITEKTKIVSVSHISNVLGIVNPVKKIIEISHKYNIPVMIDGAQGIVHREIDVTELDCDFYCFSGHKIYGPMGVGVLYGKEKWLEQLPPYQTGGEMINRVTFEKTTFNELPFKFEAGTPNVGGAIGLEAALNYLWETGLGDIHNYEDKLLDYATKKLSKTEGLKIYGVAGNKSGVISFLLDGIHQYDAGTILDKLGIAVRTGNHCAQPLIDSLGITGTIRASFAMYNTKEEIDIFADAILKVQEMLG